jgi:hypothetical protein
MKLTVLDSGYLLPISLRREWARLILTTRTRFYCRNWLFCSSSLVFSAAAYVQHYITEPLASAGTIVSILQPLCSSHTVILEGCDLFTRVGKLCHTS